MIILTKQQLLVEIEAIEEKLIAFRRDLHRFPELSFQESRTAEKIADWLRGLELKVKTNVGEYGVTAELKGAFPGPTVALRADIDALPIQEETNLAFRSENDGVMHACGHDVHTTCLLGAASAFLSCSEMVRAK